MGCCSASGRPGDVIAVGSLRSRGGVALNKKTTTDAKREIRDERWRENKTGRERKPKGLPAAL